MALDYIVIQEKCANNPLILEEDESNIYFYNDNIYQLYDGDGKEILFKDKIITENGKNVYIKYVEKTEFTNDIYYAFQSGPSVHSYVIKTKIYPEDNVTFEDGIPVFSTKGSCYSIKVKGPNVRGVKLNYETQNVEIELLGSVSNELFTIKNNGTSVHDQKGRINGNIVYLPFETRKGDVSFQETLFSNDYCGTGFTYEFSVQNEFYVKQLGKGYGTSWTDAMGPEDFVKTLQDCPEGSNFYIAKGVYDIFAINESLGNKGGLTLNGGVNLYGGYSDLASKPSDKRDPKQYVTKIGDSKSKGFIIQKGQCNNMTLNSIQFENVPFYSLVVDNNFNVDSCFYWGENNYISLRGAKNVTIHETYFEGISEKNGLFFGRALKNLLADNYRTCVLHKCDFFRILVL